MSTVPLAGQFVGPGVAQRACAIHTLRMKSHQSTDHNFTNGPTVEDTYCITVAAKIKLMFVLRATGDSPKTNHRKNGRRKRIYKDPFFIG